MTHKLFISAHSNALPSTTTDEPFMLQSINGETDNLQVKKVLCGGQFAMVWLGDGHVWFIGRNNYGQMGLGDENDRHQFTRLDPQEYHNERIIDVDTGEYSSCIITEGGKFYGTGWNGHCHCGHAESENTRFRESKKTFPEYDFVYMGYSHTIVVNNGVEMWGIGQNLNGQLGLGHCRNISEFTLLNDESSPLYNMKIKQVSLGAYHTIVLTAGNELYVSGKNEQGQLGMGNRNDYSTFVPLSTNDFLVPDARILQVFCGCYHSAVLTEQGLFITGDNEYGQLARDGAGESDPSFARAELGNTDSPIMKLCMTTSGNVVVGLTVSNQISMIGRGDYQEFGFSDSSHKNQFEFVPFKHAYNERITQVAHGWGILAILTERTPPTLCRRIPQYSDIDIVTAESECPDY